MNTKTNEIHEEKIVEAVRYAISTRFCLDELSRLLVMEGGVDLDTLARIIRENRGPDETPATSTESEAPAKPTFIDQVAKGENPVLSWFGLKQAS